MVIRQLYRFKVECTNKNKMYLSMHVTMSFTHTRIFGTHMYTLAKPSLC